MAKYNPSSLERPASLKEALETLKRLGSSARLVAGNTTLYELSIQGGLEDVTTLVDVSGLGLSYVRRDDEENGELRVGAATTFFEIASSTLTNPAAHYALKEVSSKITPPQIRYMGTIGGSICSGIPFYDMPVVLLALDAKAKVLSTDGERIVHAKDFFVDYFVTNLSPEEMVVEVQIPEKSNTGTSFVKLGRTSVDFAMVNCAASLTMDEESSRITDARIAIGAISNTPVRHDVAEKYLIGKIASNNVFDKAARMELNVEPASSINASGAYKMNVCPIVEGEALRHALNRVKFAS